MTISQMQDEFRFRVDKGATQALPDFLEEDIDRLLNNAQDRFVKTRISRNNFHQRGHEESQKRTDDLRTLVKNLEIVPTVVSASNPKIYKVTLQGTMTNGDTYMAYKRGNAKVSSTSCPTATWVPVNLVQIDDLDRVLSDPFNKPEINEPVITFEDGGIYIYADSTFSVSMFRLTYIKLPVQMNVFDEVDCELPEHTHTEIIDIAVELALETIESQRLQSKLLMDTKQE